MTTAAAAAKTAMARSRLSRPAQLAVDLGLLNESRSAFDFGCGRGGDLQRLSAAGITASGWDPVHHPQGMKKPSDVVLCLYVLNVIADAQERRNALKEAWELAETALVVAVRPDWEAATVAGVGHRDGVVTTSGTFQKFFGQDEARAYIESVVDRQPVAVAPGIFFIFRDPADAQGFRAMRIRRAGARATANRVQLAWENNRLLLEALLDFYVERGRTPTDSEAPALATPIREQFGSIRAAWKLTAPLADTEMLAAAERRASDDTLVWLALEAFSGRPKWGQLPPDLQTDVKVHHGTYKTACDRADELLYRLGNEAALDEALRTVPFGKVLPDAVYVHADYLGLLPPLLRAYAGCGRALVGEVDDATILKLSRRERKISYLTYPTFEKDAHPALASSMRVDLRSFDVKVRDFSSYANPPVLHRKELFVPAEHPSREKFATLTRREEAAGLFEDSNSIGTRAGWEAALAEKGLVVRGHRLGAM